MPSTPHALSTRVSPGIEVGGGNPQRRMGPLQRPGQHVARGQIEVIAFVAGEEFVLVHAEHGLQRLAPRPRALRPGRSRAPRRCRDRHHRPQPNSALPSLSTSRVATRSATMNGLWQGRSITAKPRRIRVVRWLRAASTMSGQAEWPISAQKCCSVIQKWSNPACSAATAWSSAFQYARRSAVSSHGRGIWIWHIRPNFIQGPPRVGRQRTEPSFSDCGDSPNISQSKMNRLRPHSTNNPQMIRKFLKNV